MERVNPSQIPMESVLDSKRIVVKVGTSVLTDSHLGTVSRERVESVACQVAALCRDHRQILVVTSGAIGVGMGILNLRKRPAQLSRLQAAAATGQGRLIQWYTSTLEGQGYHAAQILLTREDLENRKRYLNARATLITLLKGRVIPLINENDTVSVEEIRYGDNDILSAHVAALIDADLLVLLSDVDRLKGPHGPLSVVTEITPDLERWARGTTKDLSTGGMRTKLEAAKIAFQSGIPMVLVNGRSPEGLVKSILEKRARGTWFLPVRARRLRLKKRWLAFTKTKGTVRVDQGAKEALVAHGRSLLASGIVGIEGSFRRGDLVGVSDERGDVFARGLTNYSHQEVEKIQGLKSDAIERLFGRKAQEVIHRNSLVIVTG